jgi:hypothetical protein
MHVQMASSARIRIRNDGREGAGEVRVVEHVFNRERRHFDRVLDRGGLRPVRSRPSVPRMTKYTGQESEAALAEIGRTRQGARREDGAVLARAILLDEKPRKQSRRMAQTACQRA